jgi:hypothetical protein
MHITVHYQDTDNTASQKRIKLASYPGSAAYTMDENWLILQTCTGRTIKYNRDRVISIEIDNE